MAAHRTGAPKGPVLGPDAAAQDDIDSAISTLRHGLLDLATRLEQRDPPADTRDLQEMAQALTRLQARLADPAPPAADMDDPARLDRLLHLAGPQDRVELLRRIEVDLDGAAQRITKAMPNGDLAALRAATHVLIAVAGSVGALSLEHRARLLNTAAHQDGPSPQPAAVGDLPPLARQVLDGIAALICNLRKRQRTGT